MKVLVCGGRTYGKLPFKTAETYPQKLAEYKHIQTVLEQFAIDNSECYTPNDNWLPNDLEIIAGGATGADTVAIEWAVVNWCKFKEYEAEWDKYGKAAGHIRNKQMLEEGKPDIVIAFPGGKGTENMKAQARLAGVQVMEIPSLKL